MRRIAMSLLAGFALLSSLLTAVAHAASAVAVEPYAITPGKTITLKWYFTGEKVLLSGGRFGKGTIVTGKTSVTDTPRTTTRYTFDVWYKLPAAPVTPPEQKSPSTTPATGSGQNPPSPPSTTTGAAPAQAAPVTELKHVQYTTYAEVWSGVYPSMNAYRDSHGWQINFMSGWKRDNVPTAAEGSDGLVYFQQEDDSVERLAVAIMPSKEMTLDDLMKKVNSDVDNHYLKAEFAVPVELTLNSVPAKLITFTGIDLSHPGTQTASVVLLFVRNGRAYVISARSGATHFNGRRPILEKMLRSFAFNK